MIKTRKQAIIDAHVFPSVISELFPTMQPSGKDQALVCCPFHQDENPSLSVKLSSGLFHCFACGAKGNGFELYMQVRGCDFNTAVHELETRTGLNSTAKVMPESTSCSLALNNKPVRVAVYAYTDDQGRTMYVKERWEPSRDGKRSKEFFFNHFDDKGKQKPGHKGRHVLYRLHEIVDSEQVFILEGEKKADLLASWGLAATCLDTGAKSKWNADYTPYLAGKDIIIVPDNDKAGEGYLQTVAQALYGVAKSISVLRLPGLSEKGDVIDFAELHKVAA
jgi:putative DNA primase/helicase